jgi:hypothetical protein
MRCSRVVRASDCQFQSRNSPWFLPSILRHSGICGAADEAVLNNAHKKKKSKKVFLLSKRGSKNSIGQIVFTLTNMGGGGCIYEFDIRVTLSTLSVPGERCFIGSRINTKLTMQEMRGGIRRERLEMEGLNRFVLD